MELAYGYESRNELAMSPRTRLAVIAGVAIASWIVPSALVYGFLQLL
jgi:hypothetical protein